MGCFSPLKSFFSSLQSCTWGDICDLSSLSKARATPACSFTIWHVSLIRNLIFWVWFYFVFLGQLILEGHKLQEALHESMIHKLQEALHESMTAGTVVHTSSGTGQLKPAVKPEAGLAPQSPHWAATWLPAVPQPGRGTRQTWPAPLPWHLAARTRGRSLWKEPSGQAGQGSRVKPVFILKYVRHVFQIQVQGSTTLGAQCCRATWPFFRRRKVRREDLGERSSTEQ